YRLQQGASLGQGHLDQRRPFLRVVPYELVPLSVGELARGIEVLQAITAPVQQEDQCLDCTARQTPAQQQDLLASLAALLRIASQEAIRSPWGSGDHIPLGQSGESHTGLLPSLVAH